MPIRAQCKSCGTTLTVSEYAPAILTCPRCLAKIQRPVGVPHMPPPIPIRALPLDYEVESDTNAALPVIVLISIMVILGLIIMATSAPGEVKGTVVVVIVSLIVIGIAVGLTGAFKRRPPAEAKMLEAPDSDSASPPVLNYSSVRRQPRAVEPTGAGWFMAGFLASLLICAGGFVLLAATADGQASSQSGAKLVYLLVVIASLVGLIWMASRINRRLRGFLLGATLGLCLGMLALGPCAFCYLLMA